MWFRIEIVQNEGYFVNLLQFLQNFELFRGNGKEQNSRYEDHSFTFISPNGSLDC